MTRSSGVLLWLGLVGCGQGLPPVSSEVLRIEITEVSSIQLEDVRQPTDILPVPGGGFLVLDGYAGRALVFDQAGVRTGERGEPTSWGRPVRIAAARPDGQWLVLPDASQLRRVDGAGAVVRELDLADDAGPIAPTSVIQLPDELLVADRGGRVLAVDPESGRILRAVEADADGVPFGVIVDLVEAPGGSVMAVDAVQAKVHVLGADGAPRSLFGHYGMWAGTLAKPKAVAPGPVEGTALVADSALRALQVFDVHDANLGLVSVGTEALRLDHPIAIRKIGADRYAALDAQDAEVWLFRLGADAVTRAREAPPMRRLRVSLQDPLTDVAGEHGELCVQCHDGLLNDDREVWDPHLSAHPVNVAVERELPETFPLGEGRMLRCVTCHSPHSEAMATRHGALPPEEDADLFTRLTVSDSALCVACHGEAPHDEALERESDHGGAHPAGQELLDLMSERQGADGAEPEVGCLGCHAVHGASSGSLGEQITGGQQCMSCHLPQQRVRGNHPLVRASQGKPRPTASSELPLSPAGSVTCVTCHDLVGGRSEALVRATADGTTLCAACHAQLVELGHGHSDLPGRAASRAPCSSCHDPHGAAAEHLRRYGGAGPGDPLGCTGCHAGEAGVRPGVWGHPVDGERHGGDEALTCATCHQDPHSPVTPGQDRCYECHEEQHADFDRGGHGLATCVECHPAHERTPLAAATPGVNPRSLRCLACHGPGGDARQVAAHQHPALVFAPDGTRWTPIGHLPLFDAQGNQVPDGQNGDLACASCHLTHGPDAAKPGDNLRRPGWQEACPACHGDEGLVVYRTFHRPDRRSELRRTTGAGP